jgi:hypothetical protein
MSLLKIIQNNRLRLTSEEKTEVGKAHILKYLDNGKIKYAVHEQPCLNTFNTLSKAIKNYWAVKNEFN